MRSAREIAYRARQETVNLALWLRPPRPELRVESPLPGLPHPDRVAERLRGSAYARQVEQLAQQILDGGSGVNPRTRWRRDSVRGIETGLDYFRAIPYLDAARSGDHKLIWDLNRHQQLVLLAQAFLLTGRQEFVTKIAAELESWLAQNPLHRGINWTSALEAAFRALSWMWVFHLIGGRIGEPLRSEWLVSLYQHGRHLENNLSYYFSRNTHLLGEAVALHALGVLFPDFPRSRRWRDTGAAVVRAELDHQVLRDGAHFEQSSAYHVYALDLFLLHYLLAGRPAPYRPLLARMADYLDALLGPARELPLLGDDDGGRLFHPYGPQAEFGRATLATCSIVLEKTWRFEAQDLPPQAAWWLGEEAFSAAPCDVSPAGSRLFASSGVAVMNAGETQVIVDAGPFGPGRAGHSHSDCLSILVRRGREEILVDAGTYTYVGDAQWRDWFRGSAAHNVVRIDGMDQATLAGPFAWTGAPEIERVNWVPSDDTDYLDAICCFRGFAYRRRVRFRKPDRILIVDDISGPGVHRVEQFWHAGAAVSRLSSRSYRIGSARIVFSPAREVTLECGGRNGWRSTAPGVKVETPCLCVRFEGPLPVRFVTALEFDRVAY